MPKPCTICIHEERSAIEQALEDGRSYRHIAQHCGVSKSALVRHTQHRTPPAVSGPGHTDQETPRPALQPATAEALRQEIEHLRAVIEEYPRVKQQEYYLCYALGIVLKLLDALSRS
jgi:DNA-directed RNA polymerase specialized sigma24 family protein